MVLFYLQFYKIHYNILHYKINLGNQKPDHMLSPCSADKPNLGKATKLLQNEIFRHEISA